MVYRNGELVFCSNNVSHKMQIASHKNHTKLSLSLFLRTIFRMNCVKCCLSLFTVVINCEKEFYIHTHKTPTINLCKSFEIEIG